MCVRQKNLLCWVRCTLTDFGYVYVVDGTFNIVVAQSHACVGAQHDEALTMSERKKEMRAKRILSTWYSSSFTYSVRIHTHSYSLTHTCYSMQLYNLNIRSSSSAVAVAAVLVWYFLVPCAFVVRRRVQFEEET